MNEIRLSSARLPYDEQREHLMARAAKLYYDLQRTQTEIASELGLTRWQVSRLLTEARELGIVHIEITPRSNRAAELKVEPQQACGLHDAVVVPHDSDMILAAVAQAASRYIAGLKPQVSLMGVLWGRMMSAVARVIENVLRLAAEANVACFSMDALSHESVLVTSDLIEPEHIDRLSDRGAVGDILGRFTDAAGAIIDTELDNRTLGLKLDLLAKKSRAIRIVLGREKHAVTLAALKAGYVSDLITDEACARSAGGLH